MAERTVEEIYERMKRVSKSNPRQVISQIVAVVLGEVLLDAIMAEVSGF